MLPWNCLMTKNPSFWGEVVMLMDRICWTSCDSYSKQIPKSSIYGIYTVPTFTPKTTQMQKSMPYIECLGYWLIFTCVLNKIYIVSFVTQIFCLSTVATRWWFKCFNCFTLILPWKPRKNNASRRCFFGCSLRKPPPHHNLPIRPWWLALHHFQVCGLLKVLGINTKNSPNGGVMVIYHGRY